MKLKHPEWTTLIRWYVSLLIIGVVLFSNPPHVRNNTPVCKFICGTENKLHSGHPWPGITLLLLALMNFIGPRKWNEGRTLAIVFWIAWFSSMGCGIFWWITVN